MPVLMSAVERKEANPMSVTPFVLSVLRTLDASVRAGVL